MATVPMPHHVVLPPHSEGLPIVVLLSPASVTLLHAQTGAQLAHLPCALSVPPTSDPNTSKYTLADHFSFPRIAAWSKALADGAAYLAVVGDDKGLRIFHIESKADGSVAGLAYGSEVFVKQLPKRVSAVSWEDDGRTLIVADKHGDVRAFTVPANGEEQAPPAKKQRVAEPAPVVASDSIKEGKKDGEEEEEVEDEDDQLDPTLAPALGHVSLVTSILLPSPQKPGNPPTSIITADRDEHIRVSRWGRQRLGYVIERYLLGSKGAVGALALVPASQTSVFPKGALISSDGGSTLRVWNWANDGPARLVLHLASEIEKYVGVDKEREKKREHNKPLDQQTTKTRRKNKRAKAAAKRAEGEAEEEADEAGEEIAQAPQFQATCLITTLIPFEAEGKSRLLIGLEGSTALFHTALEPLLNQAGEVEDAALVATTFDAPVLCAKLTQGSNPTLYVALDTRPDVVSRPELKDAAKEENRLRGVRVLKFKDGKFVEVSEGETGAAVATAVNNAGPQAEGEEQTALRTWVEPSVASALLFYSSLTTYPKHASEASSTRKEGREERPAVGKRAQGRESNRRRIEEALAA